MSSVPALDRTVALLGGDLFPALDHDTLAGELTSTSVLLRADEANLAGHAAQTALVTSFVSLAQTGYEVVLDVPGLPPSPRNLHCAARRSGRPCSTSGGI